jgi:hypothetical protein
MAQLNVASIFDNEAIHDRDYQDTSDVDLITVSLLGKDNNNENEP